MLVIILFFLGHWYLSIFTQTFFLHRYAAHGMFTMSPRWEKFFYILTFIGQGSSFLSPRAYGIMHRLHHAHADTEYDPHSPSYSKGIFDMMWKTRLFYNDIVNNRDHIPAKFKKGVPNWVFMEWLGDRWPVRLAWGTLYTLVYIAFAPSPWFFLLLPIHFLMGPIHGAIINWYAHRYGYANFELEDTAKNLLPFDFLMMGESYHNNHHKFGGRANFGGFRWHEFDPTYPIIRLMNAIGIIRLKANNDLKYM
ncbi:acyl-CoA desaturase [Rudanella paleaurantiibacter]|uniref:Acyl-CoA desaturase n=1 Tax=Rudanella paleaurantiibacter TaxID=2614655 RepID=A0A7J5TUM7_9BACT|nr:MULTISPECIES: acyl-CoA desaturase [Rudanella]KAB7727677.1 acyl-CoA desaturase [Rudanella paleaurantiibacter]